MPRKRRQPTPNTSDSDSEDEYGEPRRPQRNAANERERARMRVLSKAFCRLKTTLPWVPADTKLSKLDTLRLATSYIAHLRSVLLDQPVTNDLYRKHPLTLTWPFSFQKAETAHPATGPDCPEGPLLWDQEGLCQQQHSRSSGSVADHEMAYYF
ncbi:unnamed protein product [Phaedon cochleariae]|uniref:BHLH domain-containing protein n=1 Tax=Phaedon cochleariae TaxID=80249 RepID=A0A9P0DUF5_PHACE|nr:unnamed protein product [Phaedon cochleariae]